MSGTCQMEDAKMETDCQSGSGRQEGGVGTVAKQKCQLNEGDSTTAGTANVESIVTEHSISGKA